jgi:hypothetical protein
MLHDFLFSSGPPPPSDLTPEEEATLDAMFDELEELSRRDLKIGVSGKRDHEHGESKIDEPRKRNARAGLARAWLESKRGPRPDL